MKAYKKFWIYLQRCKSVIDIKDMILISTVYLWDSKNMDC